MKNLFVLTKKVVNFLKLPWNKKMLLIEAFFLTGIARFAIIFFPFNKLASFAGKYNEESPLELSEGEKLIVKKIARAVSRISKYTPWESKCLVQALTAQTMLKKRKLSSTLYLGVSRNKENKPIAHAWLRSGQAIITGGYGCEKFTQVAKFSSRVGR